MAFRKTGADFDTAVGEIVRIPLRLSAGPEAAPPRRKRREEQCRNSRLRQTFHRVFHRIVIACHRLDPLSVSGLSGGKEHVWIRRKIANIEMKNRSGHLPGNDLLLQQSLH